MAIPIFWSSQVALPDETVLVGGRGFSSKTNVLIARLDDDSPRALPQRGSSATEEFADLVFVNANVVQWSQTSLKFVIPKSFADGIFAFYVTDSGKQSATRYINNPVTWWLQPQSVGPGDSFQVFGKNLAQYNLSLEVPKPPRVSSPPASPSRLVEGDEHPDDEFVNVKEHHSHASDEGVVGTHDTPVSIEASKPAYVRALSNQGVRVRFTRKSDQLTRVFVLAESALQHYFLTMNLPKDMQAGRWTVEVHNGFGGPSMWTTVPDELVVEDQADTWPKAVFNVSNLGLTKALANLRSNGGGVLYFPRGLHRFSSPIELPDYTTIRGDGMDSTSLTYHNPSNPSSNYLFRGLRFRVEDIMICCTSPYVNVFLAPNGSTDLRFRRICFRSNNFMTMYTGDNKSYRSHLSSRAVFNLQSTYFEISDCDIYCNNFALFLEGCSNCVINNNKFLFGGQGYSFNAVSRLIFTNNTLTGNTFDSVGNGISSNSYNRNIKFSENIFYYNNFHNLMFGNNREMMTLDGAGGAYHGGVRSVDGAKLTVSGNMNYQPANMPASIKEDWTGAMVAIIGGTGAGQYKRIKSNSGKVFHLDSPFVVQPDSSSIVTITYFRGQYLFIGNTWEDGGPFQLYGVAMDTIVAENVGRRMGGFANWALNPRNNGIQPEFYNLFVDNQILEGAAFGNEVGNIWVTGFHDAPREYISRFIEFRRNIALNNAIYKATKMITDVLFEKNESSNTSIFLNTREITSADCLVRNNKLTNVGKVIDGPGASLWKII